jgi:hypothetical protein
MEMRTGRLRVVAVGTCLLAAEIVHAEEPTREALLGEIDVLKSRVAALESRQQQQQRPSPDNRDVDAVVRAVMQDAARRSDPTGPLLPDSAGRDDDGFFLRSADGNFVLRPVIQFQFRGVATHREGTPNGGGSDTESGFELRRMEFSVEGNAFTPKLTYEFKVVTERDGGGPVLEDAWLQYEFAKPWAILFGQFRDPVFHEELVSGKYLLAAERSLVNRLLGASTSFVQGVSLLYGDSDTPLHAAAAFHDGAGSMNTSFLDSIGEPGFVENFGVAGRVEYKVFGNWKNYKDFTALGTTKDLLVLGAAADWTQGEGRDVIFATADAQWETANGIGVYAALLSNHHDVRSGTMVGSRFGWGGLVQASYLFTGNWEGFARYDFTKLDDDFVEGEDTFSEITVGVNYYFGPGGRFGHRAKFTLDLTYLPNGSPADATGLGILASENDEFVLRAQFQLVL